MEKLLLVDGSNLLFQMFFGMPARIKSSDGRLMHGTLGFIGALIKIIKMTSAAYLLVIFDGEHENPRNTILPDYKANRPSFVEVPPEESPFSQIEDIFRALDYMGIKRFETDGQEGDDIIASYVLKYKKDMEIIIASFDSDFFQLIDKNVLVLRYKGEKTILCDADYIKSRYNINPSLYADFKALTGDASDNIKGVRGIGPKTAAHLVNQFGDLQNIIKEAVRIDKPSVKASILQDSKRLEINFQLIKLKKGVELPFDIRELRHENSGIKTGEVLRAIGLR